MLWFHTLGFVLSLYGPRLFLQCLRKAALSDCGISWVISQTFGIHVSVLRKDNLGFTILGIMKYESRYFDGT